MALFSRKKSKAKKAAKDEEANSSAETPKPTPAKQASSRGRNGAPPSQKAVHEVPVPVHPPRQFNHNDELPRATGYHEEDFHSRFDEHLHGDINPQSCGDSGYGSGTQAPQKHSRTPSIHRNKREHDHFVREEQFLPDMPAFEDRGHSVQDGRYQRQMQQRMPMRPSSVPPQALQSRSERVSRPVLPRSSSPGPILQSTSTGPRSRNSAPPNARQPFDWSGQASPTRGAQPSSPPFHPRSPTSPTASVAHGFGSDGIASSLDFLCGLKVNKRGLILDEEGDPIAELYEGDIIDCVRQRADAFGNVLDEYGRTVGRVRSLSDTIQEPILRPFTPRANDFRNIQPESPVPPLPQATLPMESRGFASEPRNASQQDLRLPAQSSDQMDSSSSSPTKTSPGGYHGASGQGDRSALRTDNRLEGPDVPQQQDNVHDSVHHKPPTLRRMASGVGHTESLPSVPESDGTAEILLSDNSSHTSEEGHHGNGADDCSKSTDELLSTKKQRDCQVENARRAQYKAAPKAKEIAVKQELDHPDESVHNAQLPRNAETEAPAGKATPAHSLNRSISERAPMSAGKLSNSTVSKDPVETMKSAMASLNGIPAPANAPPAGLHTTSNRVKSPPLPSFPGRGFANGMPGGNAFMGAPLSGMPVRRLTTSGLPSSPAFGTVGMNPHAPPMKSRVPNSTPMVRSPLSSHGKYHQTCVTLPVAMLT